MDNFAATLDHAADRRPDKVVLTQDQTTRTNAELLQRVNALAAALADRGVRRGDVVALLLPNCLEFLELVYAVNRIGAAFLPLNVRLAPAEWEYVLGHSEATVLVADAEFLPQLADVLPQLPGLRTRVVVGGGTAPEAWTGYEDLVGAHAGAVVPVADVPGSALQRLMYTSGTTSRPKGVCISHANLVAKNLGLIIEFGLTARDVTAVAGPLYHVGALDMGGLATLHVGGSLVVQRRFDAPDLIGLMERHRATTVWLAPAMVNGLLQQERLASADLGALRVIMSGGEKMPEARLRQILDVLPDVWFADAYGLTETVSSDTFLPYEHMRAKLGSVGKPLSQHEVRVGDEDGHDVPAGSVGEILVRGAKVFAGYWRDPEATERAFVDGWFKTGDVGRLDEDGFLYIEDRKKDMIVSGGENIATPEVERVLYEHPDVLEAAVVGHPDDRWGEVPHAFVVVREGATLTPEDVAAFCRARLAKFKVPAYTTVVGHLPRTASGKVVKRELRTMPEVQDS
ncbi:acyl-CoA synthetase [Trujillonella endophytica]|uniref:Acyl-CoA synthetase (AMP-forming)/AMP-acid ligase II n=1 Tax=Trujillonella endophytica TaxID=673521 RepID=A0A1H8UP40_9ACTN|nr:long-chain fatty acid--CoA ligase [Trujillella endophytica]SEP04985.1 Acyl-CoA synthetase (AMP-forming)/AMP-acid ligase II [Trujillella endophytica]